MSFSQHSRRDFLKSTGALTAGTLLVGAMAPKVHAAGGDTIKIALVGCGNRGGGAAKQALAADPNVKLWAMADAFEDKVQIFSKALQEEVPEKFDVAEERRFFGFDAYKKAIDALDPGDVVLLTTPPAFRPLHFEYAVKKGVHVFAEKPLAVDVPGLKWLRKSNEIAREKNLKVLVGLNNRYFQRTVDTVNAIHEGKIGDITSLWVYRMHPTHSIRNRRGQSELEFQLRHIFNFNWTTGGFIVDALIHNLDICSWAKQSLPVAAQGQGGRLYRRAKDEMIDHAAVEYIFADGRKMMMQAKTMNNTWSVFQSTIHGTKGSAIVGEGVPHPKIYKDFAGKEVIWESTADGYDSYQREHDVLFKSIRENKELNSMDTGIDATFTTILGRMAVDTGEYLTAERVWDSSFEYAPNIDEMNFDSPAPARADENGEYAPVIPGETKQYWP